MSEGSAVEHIVLFNVREGVSEAECVAMCEHGREVLGMIPGVTGVSFGIAATVDAPYRYFAVVHFRNRSVIETYGPHPNHLAFLNQEWRPRVADQIVGDYVVTF